MSKIKYNLLFVITFGVISLTVALDSTVISKVLPIAPDLVSPTATISGDATKNKTDLSDSSIDTNNSVSTNTDTSADIGFFFIKNDAVDDLLSKTDTASVPVVDFTFNDNVCSGESVSFTSNVTCDGVCTYEWNFGDGSTSTLENPSHVFEALGCGTQSFNVTLTVTDSNGDASIDYQVTVLQRPEISFIDPNAGFNTPFEN